MLDLSIIVPSYNAKELAHRSAESLEGYFSGQGMSFEIVVIDDGSAPNERPDAARFSKATKLIQLEHNRGKGFAVRAGLASTSGHCRIFTDVDLPYGRESLLECYRIITGERVDFAYGDRSLPGSSVFVHPSWRRRISSGVFRVAVSSIVGLRPTDTQCGLKGFSGDVADALVKVLRTDHFAFDVEIFRYAADNGLRTAAIPVRLVNEDISTVRLLRDAMTMVRDLVTIRRRAGRGEYRQDARSREAPIVSCSP